MQSAVCVTDVIPLFIEGSVTRAVNSVLRYGPREGPADYDHPQFTPIYLDEQPAATRQAAEEVCGGSTNLACIFDFIATGSAAFADASRQTKDTADTEVEQGSKWPTQLLSSTPQSLFSWG